MNVIAAVIALMAANVEHPCQREAATRVAIYGASEEEAATFIAACHSLYARNPNSAPAWVCHSSLGVCSPLSEEKFLWKP